MILHLVFVFLKGSACQWPLFFCIFSPDLREPLDGIDDDNGRVEDGESFEIHSGRVTFEIALRQEMFVRDDVAD